MVVILSHRERTEIIRTLSRTTNYSAQSIYNIIQPVGGYHYPDVFLIVRETRGYLYQAICKIRYLCIKTIKVWDRRKSLEWIAKHYPPKTVVGYSDIVGSKPTGDVRLDLLGEAEADAIKKMHCTDLIIFSIENRIRLEKTEIDRWGKPKRFQKVGGWGTAEG